MIESNRCAMCGTRVYAGQPPCEACGAVGCRLHADEQAHPCGPLARPWAILRGAERVVKAPRFARPNVALLRLKVDAFEFALGYLAADKILSLEGEFVVYSALVALVAEVSEPFDLVVGFARLMIAPPLLATQVIAAVTISPSTRYVVGFGNTSVNRLTGQLQHYFDRWLQ